MRGRRKVKNLSSDSSDDDEPLSKLANDRPKEKKTKTSNEDESSSDSDIENYLQPINKIDLDSPFFNLQKNPPSFDKIEGDILAGVGRLTDSSESENEKISTEQETAPVVQTSHSKLNFSQLHEYTKKMEEAKRTVEEYNARKRAQDNDTDIKNLLESVELKSELKEFAGTLDSSDFESCSDSEKEGWEEVGEKQKEEKETGKNLEITVELPGAIKKKKEVDLMATIKRRINRIRKENQVLVHKVHLLCWIAHGNYVNSRINSENILGVALSLIPSQQCYPADRTDLTYLEQILKWYRNAITNIEKPTPENAPLDELLGAQIAKKEAYNKTMLVYIFVAILRALGIQCRLVLSLQVEPLRPPSSELHSLSTKTDKPSTSRASTSGVSSANTSRASTEAKELESKGKKVRAKSASEANAKPSTSTSRASTSGASSANTSASTEAKELKSKGEKVRARSTSAANAKITEKSTGNKKDPKVAKPTSKDKDISEPKPETGTSTRTKTTSDNKGKSQISTRSKGTSELPKTANGEEKLSTTDRDSTRSKSTSTGKEKPKTNTTQRKSKTSTDIDAPKSGISADICVEKSKTSTGKPGASTAADKGKPKTSTRSKSERDDQDKRKISTRSRSTTEIPKTNGKRSEEKKEAPNLKSTDNSSSKNFSVRIRVQEPENGDTKCDKIDTESKKNENRRTRTRKGLVIPQVDGANDTESPTKPPNLKKLKQKEPPCPVRNHPKRLKTVTKYKDSSDSEDDFTTSTRSPFSNKSNDSPKPANLQKLKNHVPKRADVRNDIIDLVKKSMKEQKHTTRSKMVKKRKSGDQSDDSDYAPEIVKKKRDSDDEFLEKVKVKRRVQVRTDAEEEKVKKKGVDAWVEVFLETEEKWISVDVVKGQVHCISELYTRASHPVSYIVAWNNNNTIKDISRRYCPNYNTVTRKLRTDPKWWEETIKPFMGTKTARDKEEDDELERQHLEQPLPKVIAEYKNHPLYVLKRHLLKFEALYPPDPPTLGFVRNEPVYSRQCVHILHSRDIWLKHARVVKPGEKPYKIVKARPKWDRLSQTVITDQLLEVFGPWQTQDYEPPTAENGVVPRNAFGNVELFKPCMLPKKTVHLKLPGLNKVARRMNIDCAPALVGFDFHGGWNHPSYEGFIVCEEFADVMVAAWELEQEELEKKEQEKIDKRVYGNWKKLIRGLLIRERLKVKYEFGEPSGGGKSKKKGAPKFATKKRKIESDSD